MTKLINESPFWYEFIKRLPRTAPRYRREQTPADLKWAAGMAQASPEMLTQLAKQQFSPYGFPYSGPIGNIFRGL